MTGLTGLIPAAGRGTRMAAAAAAPPKPLIEAEGRTLLAHAVATLAGLGVERIVVVTGHAAERIEAALGEIACPVPVDCIRQAPLLGLAHAIKVARPLLSGPVVVHCPDSLYPEAGDLADAHDRFLRHAPLALQCATTQPTRRAHRSTYDAFACPLLEPNLFRAVPAAAGALPLRSSGMIFLAPEALEMLPDFAAVDGEQPFTAYVADLRAKGPFLVHLLAGGRQDFTSGADLAAHHALAKAWQAAGPGSGVSIVLVGPDGRLLLHKRDDDPRIGYPGHWALFGGSVEDGETPAEAIRRELREEIDFDPDCFGAFRRFVHRGKREWAFIGRIALPLDRLVLREGAGMAFFEPGELGGLTIRPDDRETLEAYLAGGGDG